MGRFDSSFADSPSQPGDWVKEEDSTDFTLSRFLLTYGLVVVLVIVAIISAIVVVGQNHSRHEALTKQQVDISQLQQKVAAQNEEVQEQSKIVVKEVTGGVDADRLAHDNDIAQRLFNATFTWDNLDSYLRQREQIMKDYPIGDNSPYMTTFMPGEINGVARKSRDGSMHYAYDKDLNSRLESIRTYVTGMDGTKYSYFAVITATTLAQGSTAGGQSYTAIVEYDIINDKIVNITPHISPTGSHTANSNSN